MAKGRPQTLATWQPQKYKHTYLLYQCSFLWWESQWQRWKKWRKRPELRWKWQFLSAVGGGRVRVLWSWIGFAVKSRQKRSRCKAQMFKFPLEHVRRTSHRHSRGYYLYNGLGQSRPVAVKHAYLLGFKRSEGPLLEEIRYSEEIW